MTEKEDQDAVQLHISHYDSIPQYTNSDHKPVRVVVKFSEKAVAVKKKLNRLVRSTRYKRYDSSQQSSQSTAVHMDSYSNESEQQRERPFFYRTQEARRRFRTEVNPARIFLRIVFKPIGNWTLENNQIIYFKVIDNRTGRTVDSNFSGLFQVLSNWDWIGM